MKFFSRLKNKKGVVLETSIIFMLVIFSFCFLLSGVTLSAHHRAKIENIKMEQPLNEDRVQKSADERALEILVSKYMDFLETVEFPEETTAPETTAPETTAPETTAPETTAPETTAPETTAPETTGKSEDNNEHEISPQLEENNVSEVSPQPEEITAPETTIKPEEVTEPETTIKPEEVTEPETTIKPEEVTEPETTIKPEEVTEPETTVKTEETTEPDTTVKTEETIEPEVTSDSKDNTTGNDTESPEPPTTENKFEAYVKDNRAEWGLSEEYSAFDGGYTYDEENKIASFTLQITRYGSTVWTVVFKKVVNDDNNDNPDITISSIDYINNN